MKKLISLSLLIFLAACSVTDSKCLYGQACQMRGDLFYRQNVRASMRPEFRLKPDTIVYNTTLKHPEPGYGLWQGFVRGSGRTVLYLHILRNGKIADSKMIGAVDIGPGESPVSFNFKSSLPAGQGWTWQVVASA